MITPLDIESKDFSIVKKGYSEEEVDEYLDLIIVDLEKLLQENAELKAKVKELEAMPKATETQVTEASIYKTLEAAKGLMNDIAASAEHRAEVLLKNAELDAEVITKEAKESVAKYTEEGNRLKARVEGLRDRYKILLQSELDRLDFTANDLLAEFERDFGKVQATQEVEPAKSKVVDLSKTIVVE